ncbi:13318_t:CDS:1, partial [Acaulospora morrowiae]
GEEIREAKKRQDRRDIVEYLEKMVDFLTKREKCLRERGAVEEANKVQRQLDCASQELTHILCETVSGYYYNGDSGGRGLSLLEK